ncbi:hypothetical protein AOLI_G00263360 [Acnodon oligacanthus]
MNNLEDTERLKLERKAATQRRVEKAEILEHTVLFLQTSMAQVKKNQACDEGSEGRQFMDGFSACLHEAARFLQTEEESRGLQGFLVRDSVPTPEPPPRANGQHRANLAQDLAQNQRSSEEEPASRGLHARTRVCEKKHPPVQSPHTTHAARRPRPSPRKRRCHFPACLGSRLSVNLGLLASLDHVINTGLLHCARDKRRPKFRSDLTFTRRCD